MHSYYLRTLFLFFPLFLHAQVSITEIGATSSEQVITRNEAGIHRLGAGTQWFDLGFDDTSWGVGANPIGFGVDNLVTDVSEAMEGKAVTLYYRQTFNLTPEQAATTENLYLDIEYDDGYVAYLNGKELRRRFCADPGAYLYYDQTSFGTVRASDSPKTTTFSDASTKLIEGENVLAIEVHNSSLESPELQLGTVLRTDSEALIEAGANGRWFPGVISPSGGVFDPAFLDLPGGRKDILFAPWGAPGYDTTSWLSGPGPVGFEASLTNPYSLGTNVTGMQDNQTGLYMRTSFQLTQAELDSISSLQLTLDYDDGCIVFLNGTEITRGNLGEQGDKIDYDSVSDGDHGASNDNGEAFDPAVLEISKEHLQVGENILAGQVHNSSAGSSDLILYLQLDADDTSLVAADQNFHYFVATSEPAGDPARTLKHRLKFSDWIELTNDSATEVDLSGWSLSDSPTTPRRWVFPEGTTISAGDQLLLIADGTDVTGSYLHTNFKLSASGETLQLFNPEGTLVSEIPAGFPQQYLRYSYGRDSNTGLWRYLANPTPGKPNSGDSMVDRVDAPDFAPEGGVFSETISLSITSETSDVLIRYTTDGTEPTLTNGTDYVDPIELAELTSKTAHVIRARAFRDGFVPSRGKTNSYLISQDSRLAGAPALMFNGDPDETFYDDHGIMSIRGGRYNSSTGNWSGTSATHYNNPSIRGKMMERKFQVEYYNPDGSGFRKEAGIRLSSSAWSRPRLTLNSTRSSPWPSRGEEKPSFNLYFRKDYGDDQLDYPWLGEDYPVTKFLQMRVRAGKNDISNPFIVDETVRRLYHEMGQESSIGVINTLYVNGSFKGYFNMCERLREPFMQAHHNSTKQWDVRQVDNYANGDSEAWDLMMDLLGEDLTDLSNWQEAEALLDPVNMADYFLLNIYGATWDWPHNNWVGARERSKEGKYRLYIWDAEGSYFILSYLNSVNHDSFDRDLLTKTDSLSRLFQALIQSPEWRLTFADRINKHMFNGGVLDDRNGSESRFQAISEELRTEFSPLLNFVNRQSPADSYINTWTRSLSGRRTFLFGPTRTDFADNDLWPSTSPPAFSQHGGNLSLASPVTITADPGDTIYYTLDGSDPRLPGGATNPDALTYSSSFTLAQGAPTINARAFDSSTSEWSAVTEAQFVIDLAEPTASNLVISEIMYHPPSPSVSEEEAGFTDEDAFEFI